MDSCLPRLYRETSLKLYSGRVSLCTPSSKFQTNVGSHVFHLKICSTETQLFQGPTPMFYSQQACPFTCEADTPKTHKVPTFWLERQMKLRLFFFFIRPLLSILIQPRLIIFKIILFESSLCLLSCSSLLLSFLLSFPFFGFDA